MFNVCAKCGSYHADKIIEPEESLAICPGCGHPHKFKRLPLFAVSGASCTGKSSVCMGLADRISEAVVLDSDILWMEAFNQPDHDYRQYREMWLRLCKNISQSGRPVVLCGSVIPSQFESCIERRYFSKIHYLALTCRNELLVKRLQGRPSWRKSGSDEFVNAQIQFNDWFLNNAEKTEPKITLLDTSDDSCETTIKKIKKWIVEIEAN